MCVGEQGWRNGEVEKETEVFGGVFVCVCVGRDMVWVFVGVNVCWKAWRLCVCVCVERLGSMGIQREVFVCVCVYVCRDGVSVEEEKCVCVCVCVCTST